MSDKSITFGNRMKKSYKVTLSDNILFKNERGAHVETPVEELNGKIYSLGSRTTKMIGNNIAVMYDIVDLKNGKYPAHITTYFGPNIDESNDY